MFEVLQTVKCYRESASSLSSQNQLSLIDSLYLQVSARKIDVKQSKHLFAANM